MIASPLYSTWLISLSLFVSLEDAHQFRLVEASRELNVGTHISDLVNKLGTPSVGYQANSLGTLVFMRMQPKQIAYGTTFDLKNCYLFGPPYPFPYPIRLRLLTYADNDLIFGLDHDSNVVEIRRPKLDRPTDSAFAMLDAVYFVKNVFHMLVPPQ